MMNRIYLDYAATTPVDPRVLKEIIPFFNSSFGNAASGDHTFGWEAEDAVTKARKQISTYIDASPSEIVFTSGATESNNLALKGYVKRNKTKGNHIITCETEHKSILDTVNNLGASGWDLTLLKVNADGMIDLNELEKSIKSNTILISFMAVNNEIGIIHPLQEIGEIAKKHNILFHTDATQALGKIPINVNRMNIDLMSISAHKVYGPKGVGALYVRKKSPKIELEPIIHGGGHEQGIRSGTLNTPGIVGLGSACHYASLDMKQESERIESLCEQLIDGIMTAMKDVYINGHTNSRVPGIINLCFAGIESTNLIRDLQNIAISTGSACTSEVIGTSHVMKSLGKDEDLSRSNVRFSIGRFTTKEEIAEVVKRVVKSVNELREIACFGRA